MGSESNTIATNKAAASHTPPTAKGAPEPMSLAVLIPTLNRLRDLEIAVKTLLNQTRLPQELLILDQSPGDESERCVRALFDGPDAPPFVLRYTRDPSVRSLAVARNVLMDQNRCSIFLFLDDDVELEPDFIERLLEGYAENPDVTGISGIITNYKPAGLASRIWSTVFVHGPFYDERQDIYYRAEELRDAGRIVVRRFGGGLMSFRTDRVAGMRFDKNLVGPSEGEDVDFCLRLPSARLELDPRARLVHNASTAARRNEHWVASVVRGSSYLYYRNWRHGFGNRIAFTWLMCGFATLSLAASARRFTLAPWRCFLEAWRYGRRIGLAVD